MGASKTKIFNASEKDIANIGRALSHPARIRIMTLLNEKPFVRNCDLVYDLELTKKTVHDHLNKLKDAQLIKTEFMWNSYYIFKIDGASQPIVEFLTKES